ncbi:UNVERIFIED_CONTAM: Fez family zinc finger protein 2 [Trichonephila clavipes]
MDVPQNNIKHHLSIQSDEKAHVCEICNKGFSESGSLKKHLYIHTKKKAHVCEICNKALSRSDSLTKHLRIHTKERPYVCEICNKAFAEKDVYKRQTLLCVEVSPHTHYQFYQRKTLMSDDKVLATSP